MNLRNDYEADKLFVFLGPMPFYRNSVLHVAAPIDNRIVIAEYVRQAVVQTLTLPQHPNAYDISSDGRLLAVGYWGNRKVDIYDIWNAGRVDTISSRHVSELKFNATGNCIAVWGRTSVVYNLILRRSEPIPHCNGVICAGIDARENAMLIPIVQPGRAVRVRCDSFDIDEIRLPFDCRIWTVRWSPQYELFIVGLEGGMVECVRDQDNSSVWSLDVGEFCSGSIEFCADGSMLACRSTADGRGVVIEANTGRVLRPVVDDFTPFYPFGEKSVMGASGCVLDLTTGTMDEGVSSWKWWRKAGA